MSRRPWLSDPPPAIEAFPDLSVVDKNVIEAALRWAWERIRSNGVLLRTGTEDEITLALQTSLNDVGADRERLAPGLSRFETVTRAEDQCAADGRIGKRPDMVFRPFIPYPGVTNKSSWGIFVECKVIEEGHSTRTVGNYVDEGVRRFEAGEYAPRMPSGMMVAYVRGGETKPHVALDFLSGVTPSSNEDVCHSTHQRRHLSPSCVDITLKHLWLDATGENAA